MSDGFPEYKALEKRVGHIEASMTTLTQSVDNLRRDSSSTRTDVDRLGLVVGGDDALGLAGIVERLRALETAGRWTQAGVFVLGLINLVTLAVVVAHIL